MSQIEASAHLRERGISISDRTFAGYERGETTPSEIQQGAILRALSGNPARVDHRRPGHVPTLGFLEADEDAAPAPGPPSLPARGVEVAVARIVTESHDEAGLQWAVEVRFWARPEARSLGMVTRIETGDGPSGDARREEA